MVADTGKKAKVAERAPEDEHDQIDSELVLSIEKLQEIQDELDQANEELLEKLLAIQRKYDEMCRPSFVKRNEIIKTIPDFWRTSFMSHPVLGDMLSTEDQKILKYLNSIDVVDSTDGGTSTYSITFNFDKNTYFQDAKLTKTVTSFDDDTMKATGTTIKWNEGMDIANGVTEEKKGNKRPHAEESCSFFSWFNESEQNYIDPFYAQVVEIIKDDLWPNPLKYFNNEANEEVSEDDEMENDNGAGDEGEN